MSCRPSLRKSKALNVHSYSSHSLSCWTGLNCRPLPYQGSALPLSYNGGSWHVISRQATGNHPNALSLIPDTRRAEDDPPGGGRDLCSVTTYSPSGRRGSNPRPIAWKAIALPTELLPLIHSELKSKVDSVACGQPNSQIPVKSWTFTYCGGNRIRTYEVIRQQIYSLSQLAALVFPLKYFHLPLQICARSVSEN